MPECIRDGCTNLRKRAGGLCSTHYRYAARDGLIERVAPACSVDGCSEPQAEQVPQAAAMCTRHYTRWIRWGTTDDPEPWHSDTCSEPGCDRPYYASDRCARHYHRDWQRVDRAARLAERLAAGPETSICIDCGVTVERRIFRGPLPKRCEACNQIAETEAKRRWAEANGPERRIDYVCEDCGCSFCYIVPDGRPRRFCAGCLPARRRAATERWQQANPDRVAIYKAAGQQRRRALIYDPQAEHIARLVVFNRDGWVCHLCRRAIDPGLSYPARMSASLDHLLPLAHGGLHRYSNVAASHWICNIRRGDALLPGYEPRPLADVTSTVVEVSRM